MNIYGSLMDIFNQKNKDIYVETMRQPNPEGGGIYGHFKK